MQIGDNIQKGVNWICNCCGCCCEALIAYRKLGDRNRIQSNFLAQINHKQCIGCEICLKRCPVDAIKKDGKVLIDKDICIGCGVCTRFCPKNCITMERKKKINHTPLDSFERVVTNAIEENRLQDYIFDNYDSWTGELLRKLFGVILKLTPKKILLAQIQIRSRYLKALMKAENSKLFKVLYKEGKK